MNATEEFKKTRIICMIIWGMLLVFNITFMLWNPSYVIAIVIGFLIGGLFYQMLFHGIFSSNEDFINILINHNKKLYELINITHTRRDRKKK